MYRVLCFLLLCSTPVAASIAHLPGREVTSSPLPLDAPIEVLLYGFRATGEAAAHPLSDAEGNWMWDALGGGCIDGGSWGDPFPDGKGDLRSAAFCVPQPCVRLLGAEELARDVVGRPLDEGEYAVYLSRLREACGEMPVSPTDMEAYLDLGDLLELASMTWLDALSTAEAVALEESLDEAVAVQTVFAAPQALPGAAAALPAIAGRPRNPEARTSRTPIFFDGPMGSGGSSARRSSGPAQTTAFFGASPGGARPGVGQPVAVGAKTPAKPGHPSSPRDPNGGGHPGTGTPPTDPGNPNGQHPQPAPVPLPGSLVLLGGALAALRLGGRFR